MLMFPIINFQALHNADRAILEDISVYMDILQQF